MTDTAPDTEAYERARRRVQAMRGFYVHALVYVCVNAGLITIDLLTGPPWWVYWPLFGWGVGLLAHGLSVFAGSRFLGADWEERRIAELVERERRGGR